MKNVFKRGLYSLIPRRAAEDAEDVLERIDDDETALDQDEDREQAAPQVTGEGRRHKRIARVRRSKKVSVIEEPEDGEARDLRNAASDVASSVPQKPAVTLLTIEPEHDNQSHAGSLYEEADHEKEQKSAVTGQDAMPERTESAVEPVAAHEMVKDDREESSHKMTLQERMSSNTAEATTIDPERPLWDQHGERVEHVPIGDILVNPNQPRRTFDTVEMQELVHSIAKHGILQPLVVRQLEGGQYELIAGERRMRAARQLGWERVPCVVRRGITADSSRLQLALIENLQRQDLNSVEEAMAYQQLNEEYGMTHDEIGEKVGRSRVSITNTIRILQLPAEIQRGLIGGKISAGHARAILMIPDPEKQQRFYNHVVDEGLTVRRAETRARRIQRTMNISDPERIKKKGRHPLALKYDPLLERRYGFDARVRFIADKNRFEVVFKTFSELEIRELIARLLGTVPLAHNMDEDVVEE